MNAAKVSPKADVVLLMNPGSGIRSADGLVDLKVRLLFGKAGELVQDEVRQAKEQWILRQPLDAYLAGNIRCAGENVLELRVTAVPVETEISGKPAFADRIAERQGLLV